MGEGTLKSGFVCISGPTNAGKSTLLNALVGQKLAIITPKPQTTRNRIMGIHTVAGKGQIVFVDTPGFHRAKNALGRRMNRVAVRSLLDTDLALLVVDVTLDLFRGEGVISPKNLNAVNQVQASKLPVIIVLNKVDKVPHKELLLPLLAAYEACLSPVAMYPISAKKSGGFQRLESNLFDIRSTRAVSRS
jgi:GTP-binding protein Era